MALSCAGYYLANDLPGLELRLPGAESATVFMLVAPFSSVLPALWRLSSPHTALGAYFSAIMRCKGPVPVPARTFLAQNLCVGSLVYHIVTRRVAL